MRAPGPAVWLILVLALVCRMGVLLVVTSDYKLINDPADYHQHATSILAGHWMPSWPRAEGLARFDPPRTHTFSPAFTKYSGRRTRQGARPRYS